MANDYIGFNKETTFGTKAALSNTEWIDAISETMRAKRGFEVMGGMFYNTQRATDVVSGRYEVAGDIKWRVGPENGIGKVLQGLFGNITGATSLGAQTFTWNDVSPPVSPQTMTKIGRASCRER